MSYLADSGYVIAVANGSDRLHATCLAVHRQINAIYLLQPSLTEIEYLLMRENGQTAAAHFLRELTTSKYRGGRVDDADLLRAADLNLAFAEHLKIKTILTVDRRDFRVVRSSHEHFEILP